MLGMNNAINGAWRKGLPREAPLAAYRADLVQFVRSCRTNGAEVLLMSPTLVDDTVRHTVFEIDGANAFLRDCGAIVRDVAKEEGAFYVPVQEEFEAFQGGLDRFQKLRPDGVHPASLGEYQIARTLWERLNFAGALGPGPRALAEPPKRLGVTLRPAARLAVPATNELAWTLRGPPGTATVTWSLGAQRGTADLTLGTGTVWRLSPDGGLPPLPVGAATDAVIEVRSAAGTALFVADLSAVPVLHLTNGVAGGVIGSAADRPEGRHVADWTLRREAGALELEVAVADDQLRSGGDWAWGRDGLNLFWDLRPAERFGGINLDADVHQTLVNVYEQPFFDATVRPWLGEGMEYAALAAAERTATGYRARLRVQGPFGLHRPLALDARDFVGLSIAVVDQDGGGDTPARTAFHEAVPTTRPHDQYANNLMVVDLKNKLAGDAALVVGVFPPAGE
jgi:hypothetical protein